MNTSARIACQILRLAGSTLLSISLVAPNTVRGQVGTAPASPETGRVQWLQQHAIPIRSFAPADTDFLDLDAIGAAIGNARVVMLGEQSHGDGTTFLMKSRLIKYLHERMGFDVLAFESGLWDMRNAWAALRNGEEPTTAARRGLFGVWSQSDQVVPLLEYVGARSNGTRPLEMAGFDSQITGRAAATAWTTEFAGLLGANRIDTLDVPAWREARALLDTLVTPPGFAQGIPSPARQRVLLAALDWVIRRLDQLTNTDADLAFWKQNLRSIRKHAEFSFALDLKNLNPDVLNLRDEQMAENLLWLARQRYPDRKIIVWAASYHNMRNTAAVDVPMYQQLHLMGDIVTKSLGQQVYNIGFVASQGSAGAWNAPSRTLAAPPPQSLEGLFASTTHPLAFLDLQKTTDGGAWLQETLMAAPFGYSMMTARWPQVFDAIIYTRVMEPSIRTRTVRPVASAASTPSSGAAPPEADVIRDLQRQHKAVLKTLAVAPDSMFGYRPVNGVRTFVEQLEHIGLAANSLSAALANEQSGASMDVGACQCTQSRAALQQFLDDALTRTVARYSRMSEAQRSQSRTFLGEAQSNESWFRWIQEHTAWTLGQVVPYLRVHGVAPPNYLPF